jgi:hypothetical protein
MYLEYLAQLGQVEELSCSECSNGLAAHLRYSAQLETVKELSCGGEAVNSGIPSYLTYFAGLTSIQ